VNSLFATTTWWRRSLRWKLVAAFLAVTVMPMLVATELATEIVSKAFESNIQTWLYETSRFFLASVLDERREVTGIANAVVEQGGLSPILSGETKTLPKGVNDLLDALGYDLLLIYDADKQIVFTSQPIGGIEEVTFGDGNSIYVVRLEDHLMLGTIPVRLPFPSVGPSSSTWPTALFTATT
jgi:hypothetical protein